MIPKKPLRVFAPVAAVCLCMMVGLSAYAEKDKDKDKKNDHSDCKSLPNYAALKGALDTAVPAGDRGVYFLMWGTIVNCDGIVCAVAVLCTDRGGEWPRMRGVFAHNAKTAKFLPFGGSSAG